jgi:hypothetical protein
MIKLILTLSVLTILGGCSTSGYDRYLDTNVKLDIAKYNAESERYKALSMIANDGDVTSKVAAIMAMMQTGQQTSKQLAAPQPSQALQWAGVLVPALTSVAGIKYNHLNIKSNNAANVAIAESTNGVFLSMSDKIQAPGDVITTTDNSTTDNSTTDNSTTDNSVTDNSVTDNSTEDNSLTDYSNVDNSVDDHAISTP